MTKQINHREPSTATTGHTTTSERHIVISYTPGTNNVRVHQPDAHAPDLDADALRRAADVVDRFAAFDR